MKRDWHESWFHGHSYPQTITPIKMKKRILVLDDEWGIRELLRLKFTKQGFDVSTARDEKEFWLLAFNEQPDLLILDIWLGNDGEGTRVYDQLLQAGFDPKVPVIFISALVDEGTPPKRAPEGGRFALYGKPFNFELLLEDVYKLTHQAKKTPKNPENSKPESPE